MIWVLKNSSKKLTLNSETMDVLRVTYKLEKWIGFKALQCYCCVLFFSILAVKLFVELAKYLLKDGSQDLFSWVKEYHMIPLKLFWKVSPFWWESDFWPVLRWCSSLQSEKSHRIQTQFMVTVVARSCILPNHKLTIHHCPSTHYLHTYMLMLLHQCKLFKKKRIKL